MLEDEIAPLQLGKDVTHPSIFAESLVITQTGHVFNGHMAKKDDAKCPVTRGEVDLSFYSERDQEWVALKLASPARRALVNAGLLKLADLKKISRADLAAQHGMGPNALKVLDAAMKSKNWNYKK